MCFLMILNPFKVVPNVNLLLQKMSKLENILDTALSLYAIAHKYDKQGSSL